MCQEQQPNAGEFTPEFPPPGEISAAAPAAVPAPAKGAWGKEGERVV